jgi:uncharacterized membrane protein YidH (DUF202 family)
MLGKNKNTELNQIRNLVTLRIAGSYQCVLLMPTSRLTPRSRKITGLLFILAGGLLVVAQLLRFGVVASRWNGTGWASVDTTYLLLTVLMLVVAVLLIRYGWRMRRDGRVSDEPGGGRIS